MLKNNAVVAKVGVDTYENEPRKRKDSRPIYRGPDSIRHQGVGLVTRVSSVRDPKYRENCGWLVLG